ncbi:hypothetical protein quinque_001961 [Culex quinquefasciatus]
MSDEPQPSSSSAKAVCPVCDKLFTVEEIEPHVDRCLVLNSTENGAGVTSSSSSKEQKNSQNQVQAKRSFSIFEKSPSVASKRSKIEEVGSSSARTVEDMERAIIDLSDEEEQLSATMSGVNDVKEAVKVAKNELKFKRKTILFMDEIHRFNKLQQDIFLPHVESGTVTLLGATHGEPFVQA